MASAVSELYSRNSEIVTKEENLTNFRTELINFQSEAEQADQRVANRICNETSSFCYKTGIVMQTTEEQSWWGNLCADVCGSIKDFYEEYKEEIWAGITLVIDTALVAIVAVGFSAMILAGGPIALLLATGFVFAQVAVNLAGSLRAMDYYCIGDKETARKYANLDLKDGFLAAGKAVGLEEESGIIYDGCNLAATIVLLYAPATMLKNRIKNKVSKLLSGSADDVIAGGLNIDIDVKPTVTNEKLKNIVNDLYKGQGGANTKGNGTTMDAVRNEILTGQATNGKFHMSKLNDYVNALEKRLRAGELNPNDEAVVKTLLEDAKNALIGK